MAKDSMRGVVCHLRRLVLLQNAHGMPDSQLLECFLARRDEAAFEALVHRHGRMVLGVCRRVLGSLHDAEDAFQATFLVLARKASSVVPREAVANFLYGVAYRTALKARTARARRRRHESRIPATSEYLPAEDTTWRDLRPLLDRELERLPQAYRVAVVLCDLQGNTKQEAARVLAVPVGTLSSRLARGRRLLRQRLTRRGVALGLTTPAVLARSAASAAVPASLVASTVKATAFVAAKQMANAGPWMAGVAALTEGVIRAMLRNRMMTLMILATVGLVGLGACLSAYRTLAAAPPATPAPAVAAPAPPRKAEPREKPLPKRMGPVLAFVSLDRKGRLRVRYPTQLFDGSSGVAKDYFDLSRVKAWEAGGKAIDPKALPRLLKKEVLAAAALDCEEVDPRYRAVFRPGTLIFALPPPEYEAKPPPQMVPAPPGAGGSSEPARVGKVFIRGNRRTRDEVILRAVSIYPGQVLVLSELRAAERALERLKCFRSRPTISVLDPSGDGAFRDILIRVEEK